MTETNQPEGATPRSDPTFDVAVMAHMRDAAVEIIAHHAEVRSVVVIVDYKGGLNDAAQVDKGLWIGENGPVRALDAMFGSLANVVRAQRHIVDAIASRIDHMRDEAKVVGSEIVKRRKELESLERQAAEKAAAPDGTVERGRPALAKPICDWPDYVWLGNDGRVVVPGGGFTLASGLSAEALTRSGFSVDPTFDQWHGEKGHWSQWHRPTTKPLTPKDPDDWPERVWFEWYLGEVWEGQKIDSARIGDKVNQGRLQQYGFEPEDGTDGTFGQWWRRRPVRRPVAGGDAPVGV